MFSNFYVQQRIKKMQLMQDLGLNPYSNELSRTLSNRAFLDKYTYLLESAAPDSQPNPTAHSQNTENPLESQTESIVGRVRFIRLMGKACFIKIQDESAILQAYISKNDVDENFSYIKKILEVGDIINVKGFAFVTKTGELSIHAQSFSILTKSIVPLPEKFHGLSDVELRYRQRYVDLIVNEEVKELFKMRSKIISCVRRFFEQKSFLEVETPMLHPIPGGANAKPFITHHLSLIHI